MLRRGRQVLADRHDVAGRAGQIRQRRADVVLAFAHPQHEPRFDEEAVRGLPLRGVGEHRQRARVAHRRAHGVVEPAHDLDVEAEDIGPRGEDRLEVGALALEIRREEFDQGLGRRRADGRDCAGEMRRAAVGEVVAIDAGHHGVPQA